MEEYKRNEQDLYANTDNGLDILKKYIPDFALNKNFVTEKKRTQAHELTKVIREFGT